MVPRDTPNEVLQMEEYSSETTVERLDWRLAREHENQFLKEYEFRSLVFLAFSFLGERSNSNYKYPEHRIIGNEVLEEEYFSRCNLCGGVWNQLLFEDNELWIRFDVTENELFDLAIQYIQYRYRGLSPSQIHSSWAIQEREFLIQRRQE